MAAQTPENAYRSMDLIRFLAALAVVWNHVWNLTAVPADEMGPFWRLVFQSAGFGQDAVRIFFVVSGYWIASTILRRLEASQWSWSGYLTDRMTRLMIVLVPCLILGLCLDMAGRYVFEFESYRSLNFIDRRDFDIASTLNAGTFLGNLLFLQNIYVEPFGSNFPLWSLANEFWYYVWFPAILLLRRRSVSVLTVLTGVTLLAFVNTNVFEGFFIWLLGAGVCFLTRSQGMALSASSTMVKGASVGAAFLLFAASLVLIRLFPMSWLADGLLTAAAFSLFLATLVLFDVGPPRQFSILSQYGAQASFSLYLVHFPVVLFTLAVLGLAHPMPPTAGVLALAVFLAGLALCVSYLFSLATERQTGKAREWIRARLAAFPARAR